MIKNRSHWVRDITFDEDRSQVRRGNIPQVMVALRNTTIGVLRLGGLPQDRQSRAQREHSLREVFNGLPG